MLDVHPIGLMPDTADLNFYTADPDLAFLLRQHLSADEYAQAQPILSRIGAIASQRMEELAATADRQSPTLTQFDKRGQRVDEVVYSSAYRELERIAAQTFVSNGSD